MYTCSQLQYAHATGRTGSARKDLEDSRKRLLDEGFIYKENFLDPDIGRLDDEAEEKYDVCMLRFILSVHAFMNACTSAVLCACLRVVLGTSFDDHMLHYPEFCTVSNLLQDERRSNSARRQRLEAVEMKEEKDAVAFESWTSTKEAIDTARTCLAILPCSLIHSASAGNDGGDEEETTKTSVAGHTVIEARRGLSGAREATSDECDLWRAVAFACKTIDRSLLGECRQQQPAITPEPLLLCSGRCVGVLCDCTAL